MINLYDILEAADGQLLGEAAAVLFTDFCFDSRLIHPGELYVAVKTERGDGHNYIREALAGGATGVMCNRPPDFETPDVTIIVMRNVEAALFNWARIVLKRFGTTVIGIAGSTGKSAAREAIAAVLGTRYRVFKNSSGYQGHFGLPMALGRLTQEDKLAVLELATEYPGEMAELVKVTNPLVGVVTNVSLAESDRDSDQSARLNGIAAENRVLIEQLPPNGLAILNYDDERVRSMASATKAHVFTVGLDHTGNSFGADFMAYNLVVGREKTGFDLRHDRERYVAKWVPLLGKHQLYGCLAALAIGMSYHIPVEEGLRALQQLEPLPGRLNPLIGKGGSLLIDDSLDANLHSTMAALDWLNSVRLRGNDGRLIFIMGNMSTPGAQGTADHREVGKRAAEVADLFITHGDVASVAARAALDHGMDRAAVKSTFSPQDAARVVADTLTADDVVLIKGKAATGMEQITRLLLERDEDIVRLPRTETGFDEVLSSSPSQSSWVEVDKSAIANNVRRIVEIIGPDVALMAVVKANGYGHGAVAAATTALLNGATHLAVASVNEAVDLRDAGIDAPILVLGYTPARAIPQVVHYNLAVTVYDLELARAFDRSGRQLNAVIPIHAQVDTGITRLGLLPDQVMPFFRSLKNLKNLTVEGIYTHFASADTDPDYTREQLRVFNSVLLPLKASGFQFPFIHAANTAGTLGFPESRFNMVRVGVGLYGLNPDAGMLLPAEFRPALSWKTSIAQVKNVPAGTLVGYGNTYRTGDP